MFIPGHQEVQGHQIADYESEHLMAFADDWVNKAKPRRCIKVETRNSSFELLYMPHSGGSEYKRTAGHSIG